MCSHNRCFISEVHNPKSSRNWLQKVSYWNEEWLDEGWEITIFIWEDSRGLDRLKFWDNHIPELYIIQAPTDAQGSEPVGQSLCGSFISLQIKKNWNSVEYFLRHFIWVKFSNDTVNATSTHYCEPHRVSTGPMWWPSGGDSKISCTGKVVLWQWFRWNLVTFK